MQEINWGNFKAKFNGREQSSFEWLCYLLFCKEFNKKWIFGYKNQAGIETEPIDYDGKLIGFQAKFYETKLIENEKDIKDSITKAKSKNQKLNKIIFYSNQEFTESSEKDKKEPKYKTRIEDHAKSQSIEIDWRLKSYFKSPFVCQENADIAQHFFSLDKSVIDLIDELTQHTELILTPIHSKIKLKDDEIKIDRSQTIKNLKAILNESSLMILSGKAGAGKTAVIKDFYDLLKEKAPFFVFKATEFNISDINQIFNNYGHFTLSDFIKEHQNIEVKEKYIVIDSAEKLSDIENQEAFQEFMSALIRNNWKVILTTRYNYLDDLRFKFIEVYRVKFQSLNMDDLTNKELSELSKKYRFDLPSHERLLKLLQNPFYLNEYLQNYEDMKKDTTFSAFKNIVWNKRILYSSYQKNNTHIKREDCFLKIAQKRADHGHFFVKADDCNDEILQRLRTDEIIQYDSKSGGYFITHDIYEEWALEKIIERSFYNSEDYQNFFQNIGSSLPIRRAFRNWLSEKLLNNKEAVKSLIENTIYDNEIESCWKDEILISVLLSDYAGVFFQLFENKLLEDNQKLLIKIVFLLRTACKEIDEDLLKQVGLKPNIILNTIFTKPKGNGWHCVIDFIHKHKNDFEIQYINTFLQLLDDWNINNKKGDTTKKSSQIALFYYDEITKNDYSFRRNKKEQLIRVILQGASEITDELRAIFDEVVSQKQTSHTDKYYELVKTILTSIIDSFEVVKSLPNYVVKLADIFWFQPKKEGYYSIGVEKYFGISSSHDFHYFPASALQTPIFQLLRFARKETFDFILSFINKAVEYYTQSEYKNQIKEVEIFIEGEEPIKQYICTTLWEIYRQGTIHLLESIHMALEKWLLENAETTPKEILESWCLYLIRNSKSASITSVVTSIVLAQPSKLFNIAKILFQTKEFFCYDTSRYISDQSTKSLYSIGYGLNSQDKSFQDERIKTCEQSHRKLALEHIALKYQLFRSEDETEEEVTERQKIIWAIFDKYYEKLREKSIETDADKIWRLYLARMDRRKMSPEVEEKDGEFLIKFNPELDPELKKHSEDSSKEYSDRMRYIPLKLWSNYRFEGEKDKYQQYQQYEKNPLLVISETKEIIEEMKKKTGDDFFLFNDSTPAYTCSVLVRDFIDRLNSDEKEFCKEVIIEYASRPLPFRTEHYHYQISDGTEPTITILSVLLNHFPQDKENIKCLLFLLLFNRETAKFATFSISKSLWKTNFEDAHAIFLGYLSLKVKYDLLRQEVRIESYKKNIDEHSELQILESFIEKYENEFERIISNKITYYELDNLEKLDLEILTRAFELLPMQTDHEDHKKFLNVIFPVFSKEFFQDSKKTFQHNDMIDYTLKNRFLEKYSYFILNSKHIEIKTYLKPFVDNFSDTKNMAEFFQKFVFMEDRLNKYEEFWIVWNAFYERIAAICKHNISYRYSKGIIHNYLLAWQYWREDAKDWHTLKDREKVFFKKVAEDIGHHPSVLYSISKILNDIASNFIDDGISWISKMIQNNQYISADLEINTIYYIENIVRRYVLTNRQKIKTTLPIKNQVIDILNFLVDQGSITGYLLREDIL